MKKRRYLLIALLSMILAVILTTAALAEDHGAVVDSGKCGDNLTWTLYEDGLLEISGTGEMWDYSGPYNGVWQQPRPKWWNREDSVKVKTLVIKEGVTKIGQYSFGDLPELTSVTLSNTISVINGGAFVADEFVSIEIPDSVTTIGWDVFYGCSELKYVKLSNNIGRIDTYTFFGCTSLQEIELPESIWRIAAHAFDGCSNLKSMYFRGDAPSVVLQTAFLNCNKDLSLYYIIGKDGWTTPEWNGYPCYPVTEIPGVKPEEPVKKSIIVVPGITGSELYGIYQDTGNKKALWSSSFVGKLKDGLFYDLTQPGAISESLNYLSDATQDIIEILNGLIYDDLQCNTDGTSKYSVFPYSEEESPYGMLDTYKNLVTTLKACFEPEYEVHFFGYDWRLTNENSAGKLNEYINTNGYDEVILVAHSMGGIVSSLYIKNYDPELKTVKKLITLGTPYYGSPKAFKALVNGDFLDIDLNIGNVALKKADQNMPGLFELLPSKKYFDNGNYYIKKYTLGEPISNSTGDAYTKGQDIIYNHSESNNLLKSFGVNSYLIDKSTDMYDGLYSTYDKLTSSGVEAYFVVGYNTQTITCITTNFSFRYDADQVGMADLPVTYEGDGTVPLISATMNGKTPSDRTYYVNGISHSDLAQDGDCVNLVVNIIREQKIDENDKIYRKLYYSGSHYDEVKAQTKKFTGNKVLLACPVNLTMCDVDGNWIGTVTSEGIMISEGHGFDFYTCGLENEIKIAFVDDDAKIEIQGYDAGTMDLQIIEYNEGKVVGRVQYTDVPVTADTEFFTDTSMDGSEHLDVSGEDGQSVIFPDEKMIPGDLNADNSVDATDRMILARYLAGWEGYEEKIKSKDAADIDGDGDTTAKDRMILARKLAGWEGYDQYFTISDK